MDRQLISTILFSISVAIPLAYLIRFVYRYTVYTIPLFVEYLFDENDTVILISDPKLFKDFLIEGLFFHGEFIEHFKIDASAITIGDDFGTFSYASYTKFYSDYGRDKFLLSIKSYLLYSFTLDYVRRELPKLQQKLKEFEKEVDKHADGVNKSK